MRGINNDKKVYNIGPNPKCQSFKTFSLPFVNRTNKVERLFLAGLLA
jgi:hypothetical protein